MTTEEKAKAWDEAIERAKSKIRNDKDHVLYEEDILDIFPSLKESDEERIRKDIVFYIAANHKDDGEKARWLYWLEKKGEQKISFSLPTEGEFPYNNPADTLDGEIENIWKKLSCDNKFTATKDGFHEVVVHFVNWYEKQGEQKPIEEVKPKFEIGDWVVWDNKISCHINNIYQGKNSLIYTITDTNNMTRSYSVKGFDSNAHLWTIQDAKAGDLLADDYGIYIFDRFDEYDEKCFLCMGAYQRSQKVYENEHMLCSVEVHPATKEQRDLLFQKMKEAGYEWDAEKKELKKIEQNPAWSKDDKQYLLVCKNALAKYQATDKWDANIIMNWLENKLKYRVLQQPKQEWSEEDETKLNVAIDACKAQHGNMSYTADWLLSLKERFTWKPSDEQMERLKGTINSLPHQEVLYSLYQDLKKLKG